MKEKEPGQKYLRTVSHYTSSAVRLSSFVFFLTCLLLSKVVAQNSSPEDWLVPGQTYLRIAISQNGFYTLSGEELKQAGLPIESIPTHAIQIFRRGKELAIEVNGEAGQMLSERNTISFFGQPNDGLLDSALYVKAEAIPHNKYSLYADTAVYFLTWRLDGLPGKRIAPSKPVAYTKDTISYHIQETDELFTSYYHIGKFYPPGSGFNTGIARTEYDTGEGWTGKPLHQTWQTVDINTVGLRRDKFDQCEIEMVFVGRDAGRHIMEVWTGRERNAGRKIGTVYLSDSNPIRCRYTLIDADTATALSENGKISLSIYAQSGTSSLSYIQWRYPQTTNTSFTSPFKIFNFGSKHQNTFWYTGNNTHIQLNDISDPYNLKIVRTHQQGIPLSNATQFMGVREKSKITSMRLVHFTPTDSLNGNYLIISHPAVRYTTNKTDPVADYAAYRASARGGSYHVSVMNIEEIFNRYNYGEPSPIAIRNIISQRKRLKPLQFVFIIGQSIDPQTARKRADARILDMIPNAGWPGSDLALAMNLYNDSTDVPAVPIGRINARTAEEVSVYLKKVIEMEAQPTSAPWRKNILHLTGGRSYDEIETFKSYAKSFENKLLGSSVAANIETISKQTEREVEQFPIYNHINQGVGLMTIFGHSATDVTDIDIGFASDPDRFYKNRPFYPAIIANGCALGSIFFSSHTISSDWIFSPDNGAVLFLAHTFNGPTTALRHYTESFYEVLADSIFTNQPFGNIQAEAIRRNLKQHTTLSDKITAQQMNLHGDPAIRIFPATLPDYAFDSSAFTYTDIAGNQLTTWSDSVKIQMVVHNNARFKKQHYSIVVTNSADHTIYQTIKHAGYISDTVIFNISNPFTDIGKGSLTFTLDPDNECLEESEANNIYRLNLNVPDGGVFPLLPISGYASKQKQVELIAQWNDQKKNGLVVFEWASDSLFTSPQHSTVETNDYIAHFSLNIPEHWTKIYWRVYLREHPNRKSAGRIIVYAPESEQTIQLPEGIAFLGSSYPKQVQEGDTLRIDAVFRNITNIPFSDSIRVSVKNTTPFKSEEHFSFIAPLQGGEIRKILLHFPTDGLLGGHFTTLTFNTDRIPESIYDNNTIQINYLVVADKIPPILSVHVDDRLLQNGDVVSKNPTLKIQITDENKSQIRKDTIGIEIYIKENGWMSPEKRISLADAVIKTYPFNIFQIHLTDKLSLEPGHYTLRVRVRDVSGNVAPEYRITFEVPIEEGESYITVSPNPSASHFRFSLHIPQSISSETIDLTIFNQHGKTVHKQSTSLHTGTNELIWNPIELPSGIYFYRFEMEGDKLRTYFKGNKHLHGKVVWVR